MLNVKQFAFLFSYFLNIILVISLPLSAGAGPQFMPPPKGGFPTGMPGGMPPGGFPMGPMGAPSEEEFAEALKFIQYLEENDPAQLKQLEQLGQQMINQMSDEDLNMLSEAFNIAPDELREEAARGVADQQTEQTIDEPTARPIPEEEKSATPEPAFSKIETKRTKIIVEGLIDTLGSLRQKSASSREAHEMIRSWREELRDLIYFLKLVDEKKYHKRLSLVENKRLLQSLSRLYGQFKTNEPRVITPDELEETDNPYDLLGIKWTAPTADIETAYTKLSEKFDPVKVEQRLTVEGFSGKDLKYAVKSARLNFNAVEDAYEQLSDTKMKQQVDRELKTELDQRRRNKQQTTEALQNIADALSRAVYTEELIVELSTFLQTYAPEQAKQKKEMDSAEKKHIEQQKKLQAHRPLQTPGSHFEPTIQVPNGGYDNYGYHEDFPYDEYYDNYNYDNYPDYGFDAGYPQEQEEKSPLSTAKTDKETDNKFIGSQKHASKAVKASKKIDERSVSTIIQEITENLENFETVYTQHENFLTKELDEYMHTKEKEEKPKPDQKTESTTPDESQDDQDMGLRKLFGDEPGDFETDSPDKAPVTISSKPKQSSEIYPPDLSINESLQSFYTNSKIEILNEYTNKLVKKLRLEGLDAIKENIDRWSKLEDKMDKNKTTFEKLNRALEQAITGEIPEQKLDSHKAHIDKIRTNLIEFLTNYSQIISKLIA